MPQELEKPVIALMVLVGAATAWAVGEGAWFFARSEAAEGHIVGGGAAAVEVPASNGHPRPSTLEVPTIWVSFSDTSSAPHLSTDLSYFLRPTGPDVSIRYLPQDPSHTARRGGVDLLLRPLFFAMWLAPLEGVRRWARGYTPR